MLSPVPMLGLGGNQIFFAGLTMAVAIHPGGSTHVNNTLSSDNHHQPTNAADSFFDLMR